MIQQGQVFKLKTKGPDGQPVWAYRYRLESRSSERPRVGGFATRAEAEKALRKVLDRLGPRGGRATITIAEFVDEYLEMHRPHRSRSRNCARYSAKRRPYWVRRGWPICRHGTIYAWRMSVPEGHRFEATQARRQVLSRAVAWGLLDFNPAKTRRPKPGAAGEEEAAVRIVAARRSRGRQTRRGLRPDDRLRRRDRAATLRVVRARAARRRPRRWRCLCPPRLRQRTNQNARRRG